MHFAVGQYANNDGSDRMYNQFDREDEAPNNYMRDYSGPNQQQQQQQQQQQSRSYQSEQKVLNI